MTTRQGLTLALHAKFARPQILEALGALEGVEVIEAENPAALAELASKADAIAVNDLAPAQGATLAAAMRAPGAKVRWVQALSAGFNGLLQHELPSGLVVTGQGGALSVPVAEHAVALLLSLTRQMFTIGARSAQGQWQREFTRAPFSLETRTVVIVGFGSIGREVAARLRPFGVKIIVVNRSAPAAGLADGHMPLSQLHAALAQADCVVATVALAEETAGLFDAAAFAALKPGAMFVNVARGELVDQAALHQALTSGALGGAAVDVTTPEPLPAGDPLWTAPNMIISPHIAGMGSPLAAKRLGGLVGENARRFRDGEPLLERLA